ncbi:MAG: hypothetical protein A3H64_01965 [Candidatus Ryanbacteria bacterium RIFCSPLOWO2_02_FULL_45_11c]|uniref:DUF5666 domain-containing protein n=1 Tax=Candidatus Ryanbacteria bacterium RIFCSPLOWO2_02_FULL_45_11c TaxID=1802128 RepID=A0A1G2GYV4_9BACT|nr:MAG: hypothetical protein A3H64_01965 [Candidatus Ryanbacteria bacterium RIFCSPLOWO2_02_FULL_45_11c]
MKTTLILFLFLAFAPFAFGGSVMVENHVSSSANTGGNSAKGRSDGSGGGTIITGDASAVVKVETRSADSTSSPQTQNDNKGIIKVEALATVNGKTEYVSKEVTGSGVSVEVEASVTGSTDNATTTATSSVSVDAEPSQVTNVSISQTSALESKMKMNIVGEIISALKHFFSYVGSFFGK